MLVKLIKRYGIYFKNSFWLSFEKLFRVFIGLIINLLVIKFLGPTDFGILAYTQNLVFIVFAAASLGLEIIVVKRLVTHPSEAHLTLGTAAVMRAAACLVLALPIGVLCYRSGLYEDNLLFFILAFGQVVSLLGVAEYTFQAKLLGKYRAISGILASTLSNLLKIYLIYDGATLHAFALAYFLDILIFVSINTLVFFRKELVENSWGWNLSIAKKLLSDSWPLLLTNIISVIMLRIDQILTANILDFEAVGNYATASKINEMFFFIPVVFTITIFPKLVSTIKSNDFEQKVIFLNVLISYVAVFCTLFTIIIICPFIDHFLGSTYNKVADILLYQSLSLLFIFNFSYRKKVMMARGESRLVLILSLLTALTLVLLTSLGLHYHDVIGGAIGYACSWGISILLFPLLLRRYDDLKMFVMSLYFPIALNQIKKSVQRR